MNNARSTDWGRLAFMTVRAAITGVAIAGALGGCGGGDRGTPTEREAQVSAASEHRLAAGADSKELGIVSWRLHDDGRMEALDANGRVTASFVAYRNSRSAESGADPSRKVIFDDKGSLISDTLLASEREILAKLRADLRAVMVERAARHETPETVGGDGLSSTAQPVWIGNVCCNAGYTGVVYQWWDAVGATPYCHFEQQSGSCGGEGWDCGTLAADLGCLYWS